MKYLTALFTVVAALTLSHYAQAAGHTNNGIVLSVGGGYIDQSETGFDRNVETPTYLFDDWKRRFDGDGDGGYFFDASLLHEWGDFYGDALRLGPTFVMHGGVDGDVTNGFNQSKAFYGGEVTKTLDLHEKVEFDYDSVGGGVEGTWVVRRFGMDFGDGLRVDPFMRLKMLFMANTVEVDSYKLSGMLSATDGEESISWSGAASCRAEDRTELGFGGELGGGVEVSFNPMVSVQVGASYWNHGIAKNPERATCEGEIEGEKFSFETDIAEEENTVDGWKAGVSLLVKFSTGGS